MEIIRSSRHLPAKSNLRQSPVIIGQGAYLEREPREPVKRTSLFGETDYGDLDEITAQLEEAGDNLEFEPTLDNLNYFKDSVGKFARKVTKLAYCIDRIFLPHMRTLLVTNVIDERGDSLYRSTMEGQQMHIQLASEIGDIRGMILKNCA